MSLELNGILSVIGLAGGSILGLIGTGSSLIILPGLLLSMPLWLHHTPFAIHIASGTTMATIFVGSALHRCFIDKISLIPVLIWRSMLRFS